ncbi:uncharacterized protein LOC125037707 [Penaeus chinensis]|uniref:uncharacterized protein LOC125037707 n=1 Tax=Penaeus chinensis TaxID=139456 RepID=UPI001FB5E7A0|nr:uncharacterized protein LOC125037707 [Penaeus chinensis]
MVYIAPVPQQIVRPTVGTAVKVPPSILSDSEIEEIKPDTDQLPDLPEERIIQSDENGPLSTPPGHPKPKHWDTPSRQGHMVHRGRATSRTIQPRRQKRGSTSSDSSTPPRNPDRQNATSSATRNRQSSSRGAGHTLGITNGRKSNKKRSPSNSPQRPTGRQDEVDNRRLGENSDDQQEEAGVYYTFITREQPRPQRLTGRTPNFTITDHGDHWHITFKCHPTNKTRQRNTIASFLGLNTGARAEAEATCQIVKDIKRWILYLIRYGIHKLSYIDSGHEIFKRIVKYFLSHSPEDAVDGPCPYMTEKRNARAAENDDTKLQEFDYLYELVLQYTPRTVNDLINKLSKDEFKRLYVMCRGNYRDKLKSVILFNNKERHQRQSKQAIWENLQEIKKRPPNEKNIKWLKYLFKENDIDIIYFLSWFTIVSDKLLNKVNTFVLQGPTGTGKSLCLNALIGNLNTGIVTRSGDANQFHLQNLLGKSYGLFEERRIRQVTVDDFKLLFEGAPFKINVKHQEPEMLHRLLIYVSTNKDIDYWVPPQDGNALYTRTKTFYLRKPIKGLSDKANHQSALEPPPGMITTDDFLGLYETYKPLIVERIKVIQIVRCDTKEKK